MKGVYIAGNFLSKNVGVRGAGEDLAEQLLKNNWEVITASSHPNRILRLFDLLGTAFFHRRNYQIAFVEVYSNLAFIWAEILSSLLRILNKPYVLILHGGKLPEFRLKNPVRIQRILTSAKTVTSPSKYLINAFHYTRSSIQYLPNGIEVSNYPYRLRKRVKLNLFWLRAFHSIYSPVTAIEVLHLLSKDYPAATLTMIGPDKEDGSYQEVNQKISDYKLEDKIVITGPIPKENVGEYLSHGDVFLNTTLYESFGVSVLEAAACGLCIITTNVGELPYLWKNGVDALLVPPNDPTAMAAAVKRTLEEPGLAEKLSTNARKKAEQYDWSVILPQWERIIDSIS